MGKIHFEQLDRRVMLAAQLVGSTLVIDGTDGNDSIVVAAHKRFVNIAAVGVNDELRYFSLSAFTHITINAGDGDDRVLVDASLDPLRYHCFVDGGAGNDRIVTGSGNDTIVGGEGHDKIYTNGGDDSIDAGSGNDTVFAGSGNDTILGGAGRDRLYGEDGNDVINSGKGNDIVYGGDGNDVIKALAGVDTVFGEDGVDTIRMQGGGIAYGGAQSDTLVALAGALLYGGSGNDYLQGSQCWGEAGDDTILGTDGPDTLNGGDGNDLVRGLGGNDLLAGGAGDDALFGGGGTDTLYGGEGNDNLYGTDGYHDPAKAQAGRDDAHGEGGSDWFETDYKWNRGDYRKGEDRAVNSQNPLPQDPSAGLYTSGMLTFANNLGAGNVTYASFGLVTTNVYGGSGSISKTGRGSIILEPQIILDSIGDVGWLSSGAYDTTAETFVPPPMTRQQRQSTGRAIMQVPAHWRIGEMSFARDEVVWYRVIRGNSSAPPPGETRVPTLDGGSITLPNDTPGLADGVGPVTDPLVVSGGGGSFNRGSFNIDDYFRIDNGYLNDYYGIGGSSISATSGNSIGGIGKYRYLGVKRGTVLISGEGSAVTDVAHWSLEQTLLALPAKDVEYRLAGYEAIYRPKVEFDAVPTGGPRALRGILLDGGAIWLATDGAEPYFSSGK